MDKGRIVCAEAIGIWADLAGGVLFWWEKKDPFLETGEGSLAFVKKGAATYRAASSEQEQRDLALYLEQLGRELQLTEDDIRQSLEYLRKIAARPASTTTTLERRVRELVSAAMAIGNTSNYQVAHENHCSVKHDGEEAGEGHRVISRCGYDGTQFVCANVPYVFAQ